MTEVDVNQIDQSSTLGQITMLVAVLGVLISAISPFLPKRGPRSYKSRIEIVNERLELEAKNARIVRAVNKDLSEWQLVARALIRLLKNEVVANGGQVSEASVKLSDQLAEIDSREVNFGDESVQD